MSYNESVIQAKESLLESLKWELEQIEKNDTKEIYLHDINHENIDNIVSSNTRAENLEAIDDTGGENDIDEGMINREADITTQIAQMAYCCIEDEMFNDDFIQELQTLLNNEKIDYDTAQEIIIKIANELQE